PAPKADGGLLLREIVRQAILLAAREELGLSTRDAVLGEVRGPDSGPRLDVRTKVVPGAAYEITVEAGSAVVWKKEIPLPPGPVDYLALVTAAEKLPRDEIAAALAK